ncbi:hypothetical protein D0T60_09350 [Bacteroides sp. 224]|nr:hypothetical protein [Bacteroides sp. 224]
MKINNLDEIKGIWKSDLTEMNSEKPYWVFKLTSDAAVNKYNLIIDKNSFYYDKNFYEKITKVFIKNDSIEFSFIEVDQSSGNDIVNYLNSIVEEYHLINPNVKLGNFILQRLNEKHSSLRNLKVHHFILSPDKKQFEGRYIFSDISFDRDKYILNKEENYSSLFEKGGIYMGDILSTFGIMFGARTGDFSPIEDHVIIDNPSIGFSVFGEYTRAIKDIENDVCNIRLRFIGQPSLRYYHYTSDNIYSQYSDVESKSGHYFGLGLQAGAGIVFYKNRIALSMDVLPVGFSLHNMKINEKYEGESAGFKSKLPLGYLGSASAGLYFRTGSSWLGFSVDYEINTFSIEPYGIFKEVEDIKKSYGAKYSGLAFSLSWRKHF